MPFERLRNLVDGPGPPGVGRGLVAVLAVLMVTAVVPGVGADTTEAFAITNDTANPNTPFELFDGPANALGDFDGDGRAELVAHNENRVVYVLSTAEPRVLTEIHPPYPDSWGARSIGGAVVHDVDGDGRLDVVFTTSAATTCVYEFDPTESTSTSFDFDQVWCHRSDGYDSQAANDGTPWVEDVNGDGEAEIFIQTETRGLYAYNHDGQIRWKHGHFGGNAGPTVSDLDGDGRPEALFFSDGGTVRAIDARNGNDLWTFDAGDYLWPASIPVAGNAADLDGDGLKEVVFTARDAHDEDNHHNNHLGLFVLNHDGSLDWWTQPEWANPMSYTHPVLEDLDGDGARDVLLMDWNTMGHKPGNWERLGPANVFAYTGEGEFMWRTELDDSWSNDDVGLADVDGDGALEVLALGDDEHTDGLWYLDAATGAKETYIRVSGFTPNRGPVIGDFDGSGDLDWAVPGGSHTTSGGGFGVYDTDASCDVRYGGWQVHTPCDPPTSGEPIDDGNGDNGDGGDGTFAPSYDPGNGNDWWVEVYVDADRSLAGVDARIRGDDWHALSLRDWGAWAGSFHVPDGSVVEFRSTADDGSQHVSQGYVWPEGTPAGNGDGGDGAFEATFSDVRGNEWWVETDVDANEALASVEARVDNGDWIDLELKDWGSWARSIHAPDGSIVEFLATSQDGDTVLSQPYRWTDATPVNDGGGDGSFDATFRNARGNDWWVEVDVSANQGLAGVDARVDGGDWQPLEHKDWGSWADSIHAPDGSQVEFRATSSGGATDTSQTYTWPPS